MATDEGQHVRAEPYFWPYDGKLTPENTALIIIDMQVDFCGKGGYVDMMGYDLTLTQAPINPIKRVLSACREKGYFVIHTREGHRPDLLDLPHNKKWRSEQIGAGIGSKGPAGRILVREEPGWDIIEELKPIEGEPIIDKPGKGSFYATDLDLILETRGIRNIVLTGITTDVCVHTTMRDANDRGYECLLLSDCTGATDYGNHMAAQKMIKMQGGVFGAVATSASFIEAIHPEAASIPKSLQNGYVADIEPVTVAAKPYNFEMPVHKTALIMIDFQLDFMEEGGFGAALGNDVNALKVCVEPARQMLEAAREAGILVVHTAESHMRDLSDLPPSKLKRGNSSKGLRIGDEGPLGRKLVRGEPGNEIIPELTPREGEKVIFKPGKGAFYNTDLQNYLQSRGVTHCLFAGVTTEVCVQTSMREANDRGYECLILSDACASYFPEFHDWAVKVLISQKGIVGWTATVATVLQALHEQH